MPKRRTLKYPLTKDQVEDLNKMLDDLFREKVNGRDVVALGQVRGDLTEGDLLTAADDGSLDTITAVASGKVLKSAGVETAPAYGQVADSEITFTDITTNNASSTKHGFLPKLSNTATDFLDGTGTFDQVEDADLLLADVTTNDVSTSKHGFVPKAPNDTTKFLRGDAAWAVPTGGSGATYVVAASTETVTNSTTIQDDDELFFSVSANTTYIVELMAWFTSGTSNGVDVKFTWTFPTAATFSMFAFGLDPTGTTRTAFITSNRNQESSETAETAFGVISTATTAASPLRVTGVLIVGANSGTMQFRWAQNTASLANPLIRVADSFVSYQSV